MVRRGRRSNSGGRRNVVAPYTTHPGYTMMSPGSDGSSLDSLGNVAAASAPEVNSNPDVGLVSISTHEQLHQGHGMGSAAPQAIYPPPGMMYTADGQYLVPNAEYYTQPQPNQSSEVATYFLAPPQQVHPVPEAVMQPLPALAPIVAPITASTSVLYTYPTGHHVAETPTPTPTILPTVITTNTLTDASQRHTDTTQHVTMEPIPLIMEPNRVVINTGSVVMETPSIEVVTVLTDSHIGPQTEEGTGPSQRPETIAITSPVTVPISPAVPDQPSTTSHNMDTSTELHNKTSIGSDVITDHHTAIPTSV